VKDKIIKEFLKQILHKNNFIKTSKFYVRYFSEFIIKLDMQKSNYGDGYYINYYFLVKELHTSKELLELRIGDITGRLRYEINGKLTDLFMIDEVDDKLFKQLNDAVTEIISLVEKDGIQGYLKKYPKALLTAPIYTKEYIQNMRL